MNFDLESMPKSASDDIDYFVDFYFNNEQLKAISSNILDELNKFPPR